MADENQTKNPNADVRASLDGSDTPYDLNIDYDVADRWGRENRRRIDMLSGRGDTGAAIANTFMGFNHRIGATPIPMNREKGGLTFFTRPDFNLNVDNVEQSSRMLAMSEEGYASAERAILAMLDPFCPYTAKDPTFTALGLDCHPLVPFDNKQAFLPILSNRLVSLTGFPDNTLDVYTEAEGLKREQWSMIDSNYAVNYTYSLNAVFQNLDGDVTTRFFSTWLESMSNLFDGTFIPRMRNIIQKEKCYETRIYRLLLDPTLRYVTKIGIANACFPLNDNLGAVMNFDSTAALSDSNEQLNIQFHCQAAEYLEPALLEEFNDVVRLFNPDMVEAANNVGMYVPRGNLRRLKGHELQYFNWYGYPQIDRVSKELMWFVYDEDYARIMKQVDPNGNY